MFVVLSLKEEGYANESGLFERLQISIRWKNALVKWGVWRKLPFRVMEITLIRKINTSWKLHNTNFKNSWNLRRFNLAKVNFRLNFHYFRCTSDIVTPRKGSISSGWRTPGIRQTVKNLLSDQLSLIWNSLRLTPLLPLFQHVLFVCERRVDFLHFTLLSP